MDDAELRSRTIQRVYQYLRRHSGNENLDHFKYLDKNVEDDVDDCLKILMQYVIIIL